MNIGFGGSDVGAAQKHFGRQSGLDCVVDNYLRRTIAAQTDSEPLVSAPLLPRRTELFAAVSGKRIRVAIGDCCDHEFLSDIVRDFAPEAIVHYAEQPSAPYSMMGFKEAQATFANNLTATFNVIWTVVQHAPSCHIIKLGTMGEYGTPNIDIEEGWIDIEHKGRKDRFLYPRQAGSLYHTTKVLDTDLLWFYVRLYGLRVTDLMQGPVYGLSTDAVDLHPDLLPNFHYDDIFGTVLNRFLVQAVAGAPLTVYGKGEQTRGYLNIRDTLQCIELAARTSPAGGELRILNQFTETFSVNQLAERVQRCGQRCGLDVAVQQLENPRAEKEEHYYQPARTGFDLLGLKPHPLTDDIVTAMLEKVQTYRERIVTSRIAPRIRWRR